jgi:hypothetical protein
MREAIMNCIHRLNSVAATAIVLLALIPVKAAESPPPALAPDSTTRWLAVGQDFLPPDHGPGPITFDREHPYVTNPAAAAKGGQPTFRVADLHNPILQPSAMQKMKAANDAVLAGKVAFTTKSTCWPGGTPGVLMFGAEPMYFVQTPKEVWMIWEFDHQVRRIYLDQPHSSHPKPSWYGESVGHYEGETLVVDTIGLNGRVPIDNYRTPQSPQMHVVERFRITGGGKMLESDVTVEDPVTFTVAWSGKQRWRQQQGTLAEYMCAENTADYFHDSAQPIPQAKTPDF